MSKETISHAKSVAELSISNVWRIAKRTFLNLKQHNVALIAAGTAFYFLLAAFPLMASTISLYGLIVTTEQLHQHMQLLINVIPAESRYIINEHLTSLSQKSSSTLGFGFIFTLALSLWSSSKGGNALITACNVSYIEPQNRNFVAGLIARLVCTLGMLSVLIIALVCVSFLPEVLGAVTSRKMTPQNASWITWPSLLLLFNLSLSLLYKYAPNRKPAKWRWVTPGSLIATVLWILASSAFSFYLDEFARYDETYGSVGGIIILLMWLYISAYVVLIGAEINAAAELETAADSTIGDDKPMGERDAVVADNKPSDL